MHYLAENNTFAPRKLSKNAKILSENQRWPQQKGTFHILRKHFKGQRGSKTVKIVSKKCPKLPNPKKVKGIFRVSRSVQKFAEVSKSLQVSKVSKSLQKCPECPKLTNPKKVEGIFRVSRSVKKCPEVCRSVQKSPKISKSVQKVSKKPPKSV